MKLSFILLLLLLFSDKIFCQQEYFIQGNDGTNLNIREYGQGEPIIILAGGPGLNASYMQPVVDSLSSGFRCIVLNQRGTDGSRLDQVDSASLTMDLYAGDIEALRQHLGLQKLTLLGHSWGGMLEMVYLSKFPDHVNKLVMLDPGGPSPHFMKTFSEGIQNRLTDQEKQEVRRLDSLGLPDLKARWPGYFYDRNRALATQSSVNSDLLGQKEVPELTVKNYFAYSDVMIAALKKTTVPVFLIQGEEDPMGMMTIRDILIALPQTKIHLIRNCGHLPWLENRPQVNEMLRFLRASLK